MVKLVLYFAQDPKDQNNLTREEIIVEDQVAINVTKIVNQKEKDNNEKSNELKQLFANIKDTTGKTHNIDFDEITGFEFNRV